MPPRERPQAATPVRIEFSEAAQRFLVEVFGDSTIKNRLAQIEQKLDDVLAEQEKIMFDTKKLLAEVRESRTVLDSAIVLLRKLFAQAHPTPEQKAEFEQAITELQQHQDELSAAIVENTPAEPEPEPPTE